MRCPAVALLTLMVAGCANSVPISKLLDEPHSYDGDIVAVAGSVGGSFAVLGMGGFLLVDGDQSIVVISDRGVPLQGSQVTVSGRFLQAFAVGGIDQAIIVQAETALLRSLLSFKEGANE